MFVFIWWSTTHSDFHTFAIIVVVVAAYSGHGRGRRNGSFSNTSIIIIATVAAHGGIGMHFITRQCWE